MRCAITGAAGYVGSAIGACFLAQGWEVLALGRRPGGERTQFFRFDLPGEPEKIPWEGVDALVHCAYDFRLTQLAEIERVNVAGSIRLLAAAKDRGVKRGVFISSLSSFEGCQSLYGQAKLRIEAEALRLGFAVVRPGLVHGAKPGGMMGALARAAGASPVLPMIGSGRYPQYLVCDEDLAQLVFKLCQPETPVPQKAISAANPEKVALREVLATLARRRGRRVFFIPIPWRLILLGLKTLEALRLPSPFRSDSLLGIIFQNPAPDFTTQNPGITFRRFA